MSLKLCAKGVWYVVELDKKAYAIGGMASIPAIPETPAKGKGKDKVDEVIAGLANLKIERDSEKLAEKLA